MSFPMFPQWFRESRLHNICRWTDHRRDVTADSHADASVALLTRTVAAHQAGNLTSHRSRSSVPSDVRGVATQRG